MAQLAMPLMIVGSLVSAGSTLIGGQEAEAAARAQQQQYKQQADTERALSQRQAIEERKKAALVESRALAVGAASGAGGVDTPGFSDIVSGINEEGTMRVLNSLWEGEERGRGLDYAGTMARWQGRQQRRASYWNAGTTLLGGLSGASSFSARYGGDAPFTGVGAQPY